MTSTTFIRREIVALERQGVEVLRVALRTWDGELIDKDDKIEHTRTRYVLDEGTIALLLAAMRMLMVQPRRFMRALLLSYRMSWRADRPLSVHFIYLVEACRIAPWLQKAAI